MGTAHGGANEASMRMLEEINTVDQIPAFLSKAKRDPGRFVVWDSVTLATVILIRAPLFCAKPVTGC